MRHLNISLRRTILLRKNNDAGAERQRKLHEKNQSGELNMRELSHLTAAAITSLAALQGWSEWLLAGRAFLIMEFSHCKHACFLAGAAMLERALA